MMPRGLLDFISESNHIEGIVRDVLPTEVTAHEELLLEKRISVPVLEQFVSTVASAALRSHEGMDVRVGDYLPPPGGLNILDGLDGVLLTVNGNESSPYRAHRWYESLHPFMDGNGRSGRALWAWHRIRIGRDPFGLGFLHAWYYESLETTR